LIASVDAWVRILRISLGDLVRDSDGSQERRPAEVDGSLVAAILICQVAFDLIEVLYTSDSRIKSNEAPPTLGDSGGTTPMPVRIFRRIFPTISAGLVFMVIGRWRSYEVGFGTGIARLSQCFLALSISHTTLSESPLHPNRTWVKSYNIWNLALSFTICPPIMFVVWKEVGGGFWTLALYGTNKLFFQALIVFVRIHKAFALPLILVWCLVLTPLLTFGLPYNFIPQSSARITDLDQMVAFLAAVSVIIYQWLPKIKIWLKSLGEWCASWTLTSSGSSGQTEQCWPSSRRANLPLSSIGGASTT